ncbi:MAG: response regulator [Verrucomicrobiae bacterium]|nr:response regulator [Verrucomicrobiae bacterium]
MTSHKVLAIDDSLTLHRVISTTLHKSLPGVKLTLASSGHEGCELAQSVQPDLILLDYVLPDFSGDEICETFLKNPLTARTPVILMSSSGEEIRRIRSRFPNIINILVKPFTRELLIATVRQAFETHVLAAMSAAMEPQKDGAERASVVTAPGLAGPSPGARCLFRGNTGLSTFLNTPSFIASRKLTGVLRFFHETSPLEILFHQGRVVMVTSKDVELYLRGSSYSNDSFRDKFWKACEKGQSDSGCPVFILMTERGMMSAELSRTLVKAHSCRLFAGLWLVENVDYEFEETDSLPPYAEPFLGDAVEIDDWFLMTLREVEPCDVMLSEVADVQGVPALTPSGIRRAPHMRLNTQERSVMTAINNHSTLAEIARVTGFSQETVLHILYRFQKLHLIEFWSSVLLLGR